MKSFVNKKLPLVVIITLFKCALFNTNLLLHKNTLSTGENYKTDGYVITSETMELISKHLKETGGKVSNLILSRWKFYVR